MRPQKSIGREPFQEISRTPRDGDSRSELKSTLGACRHAFIGVGLFSGLINLPYLTGPIFMLQVYDRVLPSRRRADTDWPRGRGWRVLYISRFFRSSGRSIASLPM